MNDSRMEIGSNWGSGTPRTMAEAFPGMSAGKLAERREIEGLSGREKWSDALLLVCAVALLTAAFFLGAAVGF